MYTSERNSQNQNEGEGSRTAARQYEAGVTRTIESGEVEQLAHKAKDALEGPEGNDLRRAEKAGAQSKKPAADKRPLL